VDGSKDKKGVGRMPFIARIPTSFLSSIAIGTGTFTFTFIRRLSKFKMMTVVVRCRINLHGWMRIMSLLITRIVRMMGRLISVATVIQFDRRNVPNRTFCIMVSQRRKVNLSGRLVPVVPVSSSWLFQREQRAVLSLLLWWRLINVTEVITSFTESVKRISEQGKRRHFMVVTCLRLDWTSLRPLWFVENDLDMRMVLAINGYIHNADNTVAHIHITYSIGRRWPLGFVASTTARVVHPTAATVLVGGVFWCLGRRQ
jgi:hypothetical protein